MNISRPDGFYGSMMAAESLIDGVTILHGPSGCRGFAAAMSSRYVPREFTTKEGEFFFHRSRIPCTYIDRNDYIYGASEKVEMVLDILKSDDTRFAVVLESPGASLIGDKLQDVISSSQFNDKAVCLEKCLMSETFGYGYDATLLQIAKKLTKKREKRAKTVNLVGLPFLSRGCFPLVLELHKILEIMGLEVIADIGVACTIDQMERSSEASANVCVCPEYFGRTGEFYDKEYGIPFVRGPVGAPVGYDAIRAWIEAIAEATGCDPSKAIEIVDREEYDVFRILKATIGVSELSNYRTFSILSEPSIALPLMLFITRRLRLFPSSIEFLEHDQVYEDKIRETLSSVDSENVLSTGFGKEFSDVVFGPGSQSEYLLQNRMCSTAVDISVPSRGYLDISPKSIIGLDGCRRIVESVLNNR